MLKLVNRVLGAVCLLILASNVLAAGRDLKLLREFGAASKDKIGLRDAVSIAESRLDGCAVDAKLVALGGHDAWDVEVLADGAKLRVWIDARNGDVDATEPSAPGRR